MSAPMPDPIFAFDQRYAVPERSCESAPPYDLSPQPEPAPEPVPEPTPDPGVDDGRPPEQRFLAMLGELPAAVSVFAPEGGVVSLTVTGVDAEGRITGYGPKAFMEEGYEVLIELRDQRGAGYDIVTVVEEAFFEGGERGELHMSVTSITRRNGERESPRVAVSELCEATVLYSTALPTNSTMQARIADLSAGGLSLTLERLPAVGDTLRLRGMISGRLMILRVRVARVDAAAFGRYRVGCEITQITPTDRAHLAELTRGMPTGSSIERRDGLADVLQQRKAEQGALSQRLRRH